MSALRLVRALGALGLCAVATVACDRPEAPAYPISANASVVEAPPKLTLDVGLSGLPDAQVAQISGDDGVTLRMAFDGQRFMAHVTQLPTPPTAACPVIIYLATDGGGQRHELRFDGGDKPMVSINGSAFGGKAVRTRAGATEVSGYIPALGGDVAVHVEGGCPQPVVDEPGESLDIRPLLPTVVASLKKKTGGLRYEVASGPTIVGARAVAMTEPGPALDQKRYAPEAQVVFVGSGLEAVNAFVIGDITSSTWGRTDRRARLKLPPVGDTDKIVPYVGEVALPALAIPVEGTVHGINDAMATLSGMVWGEWLVIMLVAAGLLMTIINGFPQFRGFKHAINVVRGRYDNPNEKGEINHFQALTTALSATVGLGNIAGVAVAVTNGGPGAIFWMWVCGFLGMATKYAECTLAVASRTVREDGTVAGGPMYTMYKELHRYLKPMGFVFAVFITLASFGGGNMFQANQAAALWEVNFGVPPWVTGLVLVGLVGLVIVGGIKRIGRVTDKLVPTMCGVYVIGAIAVIASNAEQLPAVFGSIFTEAFEVSAAVGGALGVAIKEVLIQGFRRAAFSNEAGFGSAAIAHAAVKTDEPVREGVVALLEPFIDTVVICTMTGLVILFSGLWTQQGLDGANLTAAAFDTAFDGFGSYLVPVAVFLFAISTMISWSYYGEKGIEFVFGRGAVMPYRIVFVSLIFIGAIWNLGPVLNFSDAMLGLVAVPNLIALVLLTPKLRRLTKDYFGRLRSGAMVRYK